MLHSVWQWVLLWGVMYIMGPLCSQDFQRRRKRGSWQQRHRIRRGSLAISERSGEGATHANLVSFPLENSGRLITGWPGCVSASIGLWAFTGLGIFGLLLSPLYPYCSREQGLSWLWLRHFFYAGRCSEGPQGDYHLRRSQDQRDCCQEKTEEQVKGKGEKRWVSSNWRVFPQDCSGGGMALGVISRLKTSWVFFDVQNHPVYFVTV